MAIFPKSLSPTLARLLNDARNTLTVLGFVLTTLSGTALVVFLILESAGVINNPYVGLLGFALLPVVFVTGLVVMPAGILLRRRRMRKQGIAPQEVLTYPRFDFNDPHVRRVALLILFLTVVNAIVLATSTAAALSFMDSPKFCGTVCHTVMRPEYTAYQNSPHSRVKCVQCHIGPGASFAVRSKFDGLRQVWKVLLGTYARPIASPVHTLRPARDTCEGCHWPAKHYGDKLRLIGRFSEDEKNTASFTALLLKTGGGSVHADQQHGGIHWWHIYADNRIRYLATDARRQEIAWVELTTHDGKHMEFVRDPAKAPSRETIQKSARLMDCIDCHNRPTHEFKSPAKEMDAVLQGDPSLRELPFYKREVVKAAALDYATHDQGVAGVRTAVASFYASTYPNLVASQGALVTRGAEEAARVYDRTEFPQMKTSSNAHPNNIGHDDSPGCFRCHDGSMTDVKSGQTIPNDCDTCHGILVDGSPTEPDLSKLTMLQPPPEAAAPPAEAKP
jgi:nitrate/TMAO reductase-like tetraheme cytochrome c subunit